MSGGGFDPCECINLLNHEQRMQRLISMVILILQFKNEFLKSVVNMQYRILLPVINFSLSF